jgi:hypothetical protein
VIPDSHCDLLEQLAIAHIAPLRPDGSPQSNPIWFDCDGQLLVWLAADLHLLVAALVLVPVHNLVRGDKPSVVRVARDDFPP